MSAGKERVSEGRAAKELQRNLKPYLERLRERYVLAWMKHQGEQEDREDLHRRVVLLDEIESEVNKTVQQGFIEEEILRLKKVTRDG